MNEKDIERAFCLFLRREGLSVVGTQVKLPFGIVDILALTAAPEHLRPSPVIVEIKRNEITEAAIGQLFGYINQLNYLLENRLYDSQSLAPTAIGFIVGQSITERALRSVFSETVHYCEFRNNGHALSFNEPYTPMMPKSDDVLDPRLEVVFDLIQEHIYSTEAFLGIPV